MLLEGHVNAIPALAFLPSSYEVATASADHSIRIHDVRKLQSSIFMIPAHTNLVSDIRFHFNNEYRTSRDTFNHIDHNQQMIGLTSGRKDSNSLLKSYYGDFFVSGGFDGVAKVWGSGDWRLLKTLAGHQGKIMNVDVSNDGAYIATASYDRTFKIWSREN
jgi:U4/U6 small nuclear ribonucleoprotein PRP4